MNVMNPTRPQRLFLPMLLLGLASFARAEGVTRIPLLPPGPGNPRNSEGAFLPLKDGRILFVYTHFTGGGSDHAAAHLASRSSSDGGKTWSGKDELVLPNEAKMNVMSVSLLRLASGEVALFYLRKEALDDCRLYLRRSADEGKTYLLVNGLGEASVASVTITVT